MVSGIFSSDSVSKFLLMQLVRLKYQFHIIDIKLWTNNFENVQSWV